MKTIVFGVAVAALLGLLASCNDQPPTTEAAPNGCYQSVPAVIKEPYSFICKAFPAGRCGTCADLNGDTSALCPYLPLDVDAAAGTGYGALDPICQKPFDWFSWQTFVALNWPADNNGKPLPGSIGSSPNAPRVWESYFTLPEVFLLQDRNKSGLKALTNIAKSDPNHFIGNLADDEAFPSKPLIDRNLNFVLYEVLVNDVEKTYIQSNGLTTYCGQKNFKGMVSFPAGSYESNSTGALEIKSAWRVLLPGVDDTSRYYKRQAIITVPGSSVMGGKSINDTVLVGLIGMHIIRQVNEQNTSWVWSSFEHVDNAPDCPNNQCPPNIKPGQYSFYNPQFPYKDSLNNQPWQGKDPTFLWSNASQANNPQYGRRYATNGTYGTQVGRIVPIDVSATAMNAIWQQKLQGTVWANYKLIGSQWRNTEESVGKNTVGIPTLEGNTVAETYIQSSASCINCHAFATTTYGQNANFSFVLSVPAADSTGCK